MLVQGYTANKQNILAEAPIILFSLLKKRETFFKQNTTNYKTDRHTGVLVEGQKGPPLPIPLLGTPWNSLSYPRGCFPGKPKWKHHCGNWGKIPRKIFHSEVVSYLTSFLLWPFIKTHSLSIILSSSFSFLHLSSEITFKLIFFQSQVNVLNLLWQNQWQHGPWVWWQQACVMSLLHSKPRARLWHVGTVVRRSKIPLSEARTRTKLEKRATNSAGDLGQDFSYSFSQWFKK